VIPTAVEGRASPIFSRGQATQFPLFVVLGYLIATFALFLFWPINWPIYYRSEWLRLIGYVALCFATIAFAMRAGANGPARLTAPLARLDLLLVAGAVASIIVLVPSSYSYTGRAPWEFVGALRDQGAAYHEYQLRLYATEGTRNSIAALRAMLAPLTYVVLPLGIIRWRTISNVGRLAVLATVLASADFSILRGTDKEFADLFIVGGAAAFVAFGRSRAMGMKATVLARRMWPAAIIAIVFIYIAQGLSIDRKGERNGGYANATSACANDSDICADLDSKLISWLPLPQRFGATSFILSTSSGYFGLALALEKPFQPAFGLGHSPAALSVYEAVTGDNRPHLRTFTYRNGDDHWSEDYYWSTLVTWIANDVGFVGALPVLGLLGYLWGLWWREATAGLSDPAAALFTIVTTMMFYFPANNEFLASYEGYTILLAWLSVWLWHRRARALSVLTAA